MASQFTKAVTLFSVPISWQLNAAPYLCGVHKLCPLLREETVRDSDSKLHCTQYTYMALFEPLVLVLATSIICCFSGVAIGFNITEYSVSENASNVSAVVSVLSGTLARGVSVRVFTSDNSATSEGECKFNPSDFLLTYS